MLKAYKITVAFMLKGLERPFSPSSLRLSSQEIIPSDFVHQGAIEFFFLTKLIANHATISRRIVSFVRVAATATRCLLQR